MEGRWLRRESEYSRSSFPEIDSEGNALDPAGRTREFTKLLGLDRTYFDLFDSAYDSILVCDSDRRIVMVNREFLSTFDYRFENVIHENISLVLPVTFETFLDQDFIRAKETATEPIAKRCESLARKSDGTLFFVEISVSSVKTPNGLRFMAIIRDISKKKRLESQQTFLAETAKILNETADYEERLKRITDSLVPEYADACVVRMIEAGKLVFKTVKARSIHEAELFKTAALEVSEMNGAFTPSGAITQAKTIIVTDVEKQLKEFHSQNKRHQFWSNKLKSNSFVIVPMFAQGKVIGTLTLAMTSSHRTFTAEDLDFVNEAAQRFALALENAKLLLAAKMAIVARERVLAAVAHDLRNPLASIGLTTDVLSLLDNESPDKAELLQRLKSSTVKMGRLVSDLLDFGRMEAGGFSIKREYVSVDKIVSESLAELRPKIEGSGITVTIKRPLPEMKVFCDPLRVVQVLWNLIGNALKFTPRGRGVTLSVEAHREKIDFCVIDEGCGIRQANLPKIFDQFWQAEETATLGAGLGLAIARGIVEAHGGRIWAESTEGKGSTFCFFIPNPPIATNL